VDPSSLIFLAILGVWAAYLVPHWLRRRDELSQSRTPDRFSGGLRVLQRRSRKPRPDRAVHRSGDAVLTSPRVVVDADGEFLYIPADRALAARAQREAEEAARIAASAASEAAAAEAAASEAAEAEALEAAELETAEREAAELEAAEIRAAEAQAARIKIAAQSRAARDEAAQVRAAQLEAAQTEALAQAQAMAQARVAKAEALAEAEAQARTETRAPSLGSTPAAVAYRAARTAAQPPAPPEYEDAEFPSDLEVAIACARVAARRRAAIMALLFLTTVASWVVATMSTMSVWVAVPATVLLMLHVLASRVAGLRSRESLMLLAVQVHAEELAESRAQRAAAAAARPAEVAATVEAALTPDRVSRRAAAVGADTWEPIPVPPPTYTLKPAVHRPPPAPLDVPAAPAAVSRGALPRRAADVERILGVESHLDELFEEPKVVNG
jgi:hypothetical protein